MLYVVTSRLRTTPLPFPSTHTRARARGHDKETHSEKTIRDRVTLRIEVSIPKRVDTYGIKWSLMRGAVGDRGVQGDVGGCRGYVCAGVLWGGGYKDTHIT